MQCKSSAAFYATVLNKNNFSLKNNKIEGVLVKLSL